MEVCKTVFERSTNIKQLMIGIEVAVSMSEQMEESRSPVVAIMFGTWLSLLSNLKALSG